MDSGMKMHKKISFTWLLLPLSILIFLAFALFVERSGINYQISHKPSYFLKPMNEIPTAFIEQNPESESDCLILYDAQSQFQQTRLGSKVYWFH